MQYRCISAVLSAVLFAFSLSGVVSAEETYTEGTYGRMTYRNYGTHIEITACEETAESVAIPAEIDGIPVTAIGDYAFQYCPLTVLEIPDSITRIGKYAFRMTDITELTLPESVTVLGQNAFQDCDALLTVTLPDSITVLEWCTFSGCDNLVSVKLPVNLERIGSEVFFSCDALTDITIPATVTEIGHSAFFMTSLTEFTFPDGIQKITGSVLSKCSNLTTVTIPESVTSIDRYAFASSSNLTDIYYAGTQEQWEEVTEYYADAEANQPSPTIHYGAAAPESLRGDLNADDSADALDAALLQQYLLGRTSFTETQFTAADLNVDSAVNAFDLAALKRIIFSTN